jgi:ribonuclease-3
LPGFPAHLPTTEMRALADRLEWPVRDPELLAQAMAHRSWCAEHVGLASNERLEFLGDAVLGVVVTDHLYRSYPALPEGELAKARAAVVNSVTLAEVAGELRIGEAILLGRGEDASGGRTKMSILADATEAVIGAVYLDGGSAAAEALVMRLVGPRISVAAAGPGGDDYKTRLQELCARRFDQLPDYILREAGPDHAKRFDAVVKVRGTAQGSGQGRSKKQAEQAAARQAWEHLGGDTGGAAGDTDAAAGVDGRGDAAATATHRGASPH